MRRRWIWPVGAVALCAGVWAFLHFSDDRLHLGDRQPFEKGHYAAFAQPWAGAEDRVLKHWAGFADRISIEPARFPRDSEIAWAWPWAPHGTAVGVWGYDFLSYGQYDGGSEEVALTPKRVRDITVLRQTFDWRRAMTIGDANLLTEFYLRSNPADSESKLLEIGWFLHTPDRTRKFVENGKQIGVFVDGQGRKWRVSLDEKYCTLMPLDGQDIPSGSLDMLEALRWLQSKGVVRGDEWFTGVAFGAEPLWGAGKIQVKRWGVEYR